MEPIETNNDSYHQMYCRGRHWSRSLLAALLAIALIGFAANQFVSARNGVRQSDASTHTITISAQGKVTATPDLATINASVQGNGKTASDAQNQMSKNAQGVVDFLKGQGVSDSDVNTANYNIYPNRDYSAGKTGQIVDYNASETLTVKLHDIKKLGAVLDGMVKNGADQVNNVSYSIDDPDSLREQAREKALANAKDKAQNLAKAAGVKLGKLVSFSENPASVPGPIMYDRSVAGMGAVPAAAPESQLPAGNQEVTAEINVIYEIGR